MRAARARDDINMEDTLDRETTSPCMPSTPSANVLPSCETISTSPTDPKDPEGFLRRCSGHSKIKGVRCSQPIGRNARDSHPTFLPTCKSHRDQQSLAGWCQFTHEDGEKCSRLFRWSPPCFQICSEHEGHPNNPCFLWKLPLELRLHILSYLLPTGPIGSSFAPGHEIPFATGYLKAQWQANLNTCPRRTQKKKLIIPEDAPGAFSVSLIDLFLVNHQLYAETQDLFFSTTPFVIDVRKDGTFMCGRRLLEPKRADGSSHFLIDDEPAVRQRFINNFVFRNVKNYTINIFVENCRVEAGPSRPNWADTWDEEVEIYDIRDYIGVVVSGILAHSAKLYKLDVNVGYANFEWSEAEVLANTKCLVGPFERLRNVRQPRLCGVYDGSTNNHFMLTVRRNPRLPTVLCSVPQMPTCTMLMGPGDEEFDTFKSNWERQLHQSAATSLAKKAPIRAMFTEFKEFYSKLSAIAPEVARPSGRQAFLHRARVARETENVKQFRQMRNELVDCWYAYLESEERRKDRINAQLSQMLDMDIYPSMEEDIPHRRHSEASSCSETTSPVGLDTDKMANEGIPMQANHNYHMLELKRMAHMQREQAAMQRIRQSNIQHSTRSETQTSMLVPRQEQPTHQQTLSSGAVTAEGSKPPPAAGPAMSYSPSDSCATLSPAAPPSATLSFASTACTVPSEQESTNSDPNEASHSEQSGSSYSQFCTFKPWPFSISEKDTGTRQDQVADYSYDWSKPLPNMKAWATLPASRDYIPTPAANMTAAFLDTATEPALTAVKRQAEDPTHHDAMQIGKRQRLEETAFCPESDQSQIDCLAPWTQDWLGPTLEI